MSPRVRQHPGGRGRALRPLRTGRGGERRGRTGQGRALRGGHARPPPRGPAQGGRSARSTPAQTLVADAFGELVRRSWVTELGRGRVALRGPALAVVRAVDEDAARIARSLWARSTRPTRRSYRPRSWRAADTFAHFPQTVSLVTRLDEDYDAIERFRQSNAEATEIVQPPPEAVAPFEACLLPALCYAGICRARGTPPCRGAGSR